MKKGLFVLFTAVILLLVSFPVFSVSTPVARVNLTRNTVITKEQLDEAVTEYSAVYGTDLDSAQVLDSLINDELFLQGSERAGLILTDENKATLLESQKASMESQLGYALTEEQFAQVVEQYYGMTVEEFKEALAQQYVLEAYVTNAKTAMFEAMQPPTDAEIEAFFKKNRSVFVNAENVKLAHIYFEFGDDKVASLAKAKSVADQIKAGSITFEKGVSTYSEDTVSKTTGGDLGWLVIDSAEDQEYMGQNFFDKVFALDEGQVSDVIESLQGYHIVKVSVHNDAKLLSLTDTISPTLTTTVQEYIANNLAQEIFTATFTEAYSTLIADLRSEASIRYLN